MALLYTESRGSDNEFSVLAELGREGPRNYFSATLNDIGLLASLQMPSFKHA